MPHNEGSGYESKIINRKWFLTQSPPVLLSDCMEQLPLGWTANFLIWMSDKAPYCWRNGWNFYFTVSGHLYEYITWPCDGNTEVTFGATHVESLQHQHYIWQNLCIHLHSSSVLIKWHKMDITWGECCYYITSAPSKPSVFHAYSS